MQLGRQSDIEGGARRGRCSFGLVAGTATETPVLPLLLLKGATGVRVVPMVGVLLLIIQLDSAGARLSGRAALCERVGPARRMRAAHGWSVLVLVGGGVSARTGDQRHHQRQDQEQAGGGEGGRDAVGEQRLWTIGRRAGGVEDGHGDAEAEGAPEVVRDVDEAAGDAGVLQPGTRQIATPAGVAATAACASASNSVP
jgi:hypothetical protein